MPSNLAAERGILGAILLDNEVYYQAPARGLQAAHFYLDSHQRIYRAMQDLNADKFPVDIITLAAELESNKEIHQVGGVAYVASLTDGMPRRENIGSYIDIVLEQWRRRELIHLCNRSTAMAMDPSEDVEWCLGGLASDLVAVQGNSIRQPGQLVKEFSAEVLAEIKTLMYLDRATVGLPFGIDALDDVTTGMRKGEQVVAAGFTGSGKTAFAVSVAHHNAKAGRPVVFFSMEMPKDQILLRFWAQVADISHSKLRKPGDLSRSDYAALERAKEEVDKWPLIIDDASSLEIGELVARAQLYIAKHKAELIITDYLQLATAAGCEKRSDEVAKVSGALRGLAKTTNTASLALSQLSRPEKRDVNAVPNLFMLRESGAIEQDANLVVFTYHPVDDKNTATGQDAIIIGKQRAGVCGHIPATYHSRILQWGSRVEPHQPVKDKPKQTTLADIQGA